MGERVEGRAIGAEKSEDQWGVRAFLHVCDLRGHYPVPGAQSEADPAPHRLFMGPAAAGPWRWPRGVLADSACFEEAAVSVRPGLRSAAHVSSGWRQEAPEPHPHPRP